MYENLGGYGPLAPRFRRPWACTLGPGLEEATVHFAEIKIGFFISNLD